MTDLVFEPTTAPAHTRPVLPNPFIEAVQQLTPNSTDALQVKLTDATRTDINRVQRNLNEAGTELGVTVRRTWSDAKGAPLTNDDIKSLGDKDTVTATVKFWVVAKIKRTKKDEQEVAAAPAE